MVEAVCYPRKGMDAHGFLVALTIVLGVAAVTTIVCQRLRQPVVLGYMLADFIIGPHVPIPLVADPRIIQALSELGVMLVMFALGLGFSLGKLLSLGPTAGLTAVLESSLMVWLGFVSARLLGWTTIECLFTGAIVAISSTTIIAKAFDEQRVTRPIRELVVGILVVEDVIAVLLMAILTAIASGTGLSASEMAVTTARLALFLVGLVAVGLLLVPRAVRALGRLDRPETTVVASLAFCFGVSLLALELGYSVALGAFIAGSLIAESGEGKPVQRLIAPVRDLFAAIFFVSVGMLIDPSIMARHWLAIAVLTGVVVVGKVVGVSVGAFLTGNGVRTSVQSGMSLAQIGEFSFIIAGLGLSLRATGEVLYPVAIAVSAITTLTTPWLIRASGPVASFVDRTLPRPLQTFVALYGSWLERFHGHAGSTARRSAIPRLVRLLLLDLTVLTGIVIGSSVAIEPMAAFVEDRLGLDAAVAWMVIVAAAMALAVPLSAGIVRVARRLGRVIAEAALPVAAEAQVDLGAAPRHALLVTLQFAILLVAGLLLLAVTQPFVGGAFGAILFGVLVVALGVALWRGAADLHGHVRAGAQALVAALVAQARTGGVTMPADDGPADGLTQIHEILPGLGEPISLQLDEASAAVGKSLTALNLRGITGATVLAIARGEQGLHAPTAKEVLQAGDILAVAGTRDAVEAARELLTRPRAGAGRG